MLAKRADLPLIAKTYSGKQVMLLVRISFPDAVYGVPETEIPRKHDSINVFYRSLSRNTFEFDFRIHPEILMAPKTQAYFSEGNEAHKGELLEWIKTRVKELSLVPGKDYDKFLANFPGTSARTWGLSDGEDGIANYVGGSYDASVAAHELGHTVGLPHARSIEAGTDIWDSPGARNFVIEYGDPFSVMGHPYGWEHFHVDAKWKVGWMDKEEVIEVKTSGVYRLHAHDNPVHKGRLLGVRVPTSNTYLAYWLEYRNTNSTAGKGASVMMEGYMGPSASATGTYLLDMSPGGQTVNDSVDATLEPGKEFTDRFGGTVYRTLGIQSGSGNEPGWVEVRITLPGGIRIVSPEKRGPWEFAAGFTGLRIDALGRTPGAAGKQGTRIGYRGTIR